MPRRTARLSSRATTLHTARRASATVALLVSASLAAAVAESASALPQAGETRRLLITGDRLSGMVLPTQPISANMTINADRAWTWTVDDTQRLELRGNVSIRFASFFFTTDAAQVWINRLPVQNADGTPGEVNQIAIYFLEASEPTRRAGFGAQGRDLLVTSATRGDVALNVTRRIHGVPPTSELLLRGQSRLATFLRQVQAAVDEGTARLSATPILEEPIAPPVPPPQPGDPLELPNPKAAAQADSVTLPGLEGGVGTPIFRPDGVISFVADEIVVDQKANAITIEGGVSVEYLSDVAQGAQTLEMRAERGVAFLAPDAVKAIQSRKREIRAGDILGLYLEGGVVATDGNYTVRGAKIYYDFQKNRATIVDAVLRTYTREGRMLTLYARAKEMRQISAQEFEANQATVSTSEFFVPHLSVGAERATITEAPAGTGGPARITAEKISFRAGHVPFFGLPYFEGTTEPQPFRGAEAGYRSDYGAEILTNWDLFQLLGITPPSGTDAMFTIGGYTERGPAAGTEITYDAGRTSGALDLFGLYDFGGTDRTAAGEDVDKDQSMRGIVDGEYQMPLSANANLQLQLAYISDQTFVSTFRRDDFEARREYESSIYYISQNANTALTLLLKYGLNGFLSNSYLLASRAYQVDKYPELTYRRFADDLGGFNWTQSWSVNAMALRPTKGSPNSLGIPAAAFGLVNPATDIPDAFEAAGYNDATYARGYTRHEFSYTFSENNWSLVPFAHGSAAGYFLNDFNAYSATPEDIAFMLGGGARGSMRFVRIDDKVESRFFDLHRMRHIIEPNALLWYGYDSTEPGSFPIFDQDVEGALGGSIAQLGVRQQWQTQRGGAGAWESVNFLTIDAGVVLSPEDDDFQATDLNNPLKIAQSALPSFYSWRPELSQYGSNVYGAGVWQLSDTFTLAGSGTVLLEDRAGVTDPDAILRNLAKGAIGLEMRHSPEVSTYVEYRVIAPTSSDLIQFGVVYQLGKKYVIALSPQYDLDAGELREITGSIARTFPDFNLAFSAGYDLIEDQTTGSLRLSIPADTAQPMWNPMAGDGTSYSSDGLGR